MLDSGGAGGKAVNESSDSTWNLDFKRQRVERANEEAHINEDEDDSSDSDSDDDCDGASPFAGSRFMDMSNLHEVSKNFCCKKCTQALIREVAEQRFNWLAEFSEELVKGLGYDDRTKEAKIISDLKENFFKSKLWESARTRAPNNLRKFAKRMGVSIVE